jgi:hypothetical protein
MSLMGKKGPLFKKKKMKKKKKKKKVALQFRNREAKGWGLGCWLHTLPLRCV